MKNKGLISVIIPVYNVEKYLRECVDSVLGQTYKNYEIILVDDGSTDASGKICDEYATEFSQVSVIHKENGGLSDARNTGFVHSSGEYVYFLDSDDFIVPEAFEKLILLALKEQSDFVFFDAVSFEDKNNDYNIPQNYARKKQYETANGNSVLEKLIVNKDFHSAVQMYLYNKKFLEDNNLTFISGCVYEDIFFSYQAFCLAERVSHLWEKLYYRRYREDSIMTSKKSEKYFSSICKIYESIVEFSENEDILHLSVSQKYISRCAFNVFNNYEKLNKLDKKNCKTQLDNIKSSILKYDAYGDKALKMRCYSKVFWFIYKVFEKTLGRLFA